MKTAIRAIAALSLLAATQGFAESDHFSCQFHVGGETGCAVSQANILDTSYDYERVVSVDYNFACGKIVGPSTIQLKSESDQSGAFSYASAGTLTVRSMGKVSLVDGNAPRTYKMTFAPGCRLIVNNISSSLSDQGLAQLTAPIDAHLATADAYLAELSALEGVDVWYKLYINGGINQSGLQQVIGMLSGKTDPISRRQVSLLQKVIDSGAVLNLSGDIDAARAELANIRDQLLKINSRLIEERGLGRQSIDDKVKQINERLS
jgi:hypothetical protein